MKALLNFFIRLLPFTVGIILILTSLTFLVEFTDQNVDLGDLDNEEFWAFVFFSVIGIPTLLYGIKKASDDNL